MKVDKELVVSTWAVQGLKDFYISFEFEHVNKWHTYSTFFCHQGLEKISKAYLIATRSAEYEDLGKEEALKKVNNIAKEYQHSLQKLLEALISHNALTRAEVSCRLERYRGQEIVDVLEKVLYRKPLPRAFTNLQKVSCFRTVNILQNVPCSLGKYGTNKIFTKTCH